MRHRRQVQVTAYVRSKIGQNKAGVVTDSAIPPNMLN